MEEGFPPSSQLPPGWDSPPSSPEVTRFGKRPAGKGLKRPMVQSPPESEAPDLGEYFEQFDISDKDIILLCRGYASYLAARGKGQRK